ncbi:triose-phosphate transporter family-domain-containing protein [Syncephalis plumigaleata]|nr:triose-phosphate transporter family-domain-containing protein [Syncephalis plumigaleata]
MSSPPIDETSADELGLSSLTTRQPNNYVANTPLENHSDTDDDLIMDSNDDDEGDFVKELARYRRLQDTQSKSEPPGLDWCIGGRAFWRSQMSNIFFIGAWYTLSTLLSLYNKWMFDPKKYGFHYPLFTTSMHQVIQFVLALSCLTIWPHLRPRYRMGVKEFSKRVVPCAVATGLDIGLSNSSLKTITLSFYTMCKSSSLAFVLVFAFLFRLEKPRMSLIVVISIISIGVLMMVADETDFELTGFIQVMLAALMGGLRWSLTQMLLRHGGAPAASSQLSRRAHGGNSRVSTSSSRSATGGNGATASGHGHRQHPIASVMLLSPVMALCLLVVAICLEGGMLSSGFFSSVGSTIRTLGYMSLGGFIAFFMVVSEFVVIRSIGVVTLSVCGILKEVLTIVVSTLVFGDRLTALNLFGLFVTMVGIGTYNWLKIRQQAAEDEAAYMEGYRQVVERTFGEDAVYFAAADAFDDNNDDDDDIHSAVELARKGDEQR